MIRFSYNKLYIFCFISFLLSSSYIYGKEFTIKWNKNPNSIKYVVELSKTKDFKVINKRLTIKGLRTQLELDVGIYYVRVYGINRDKSKTKYSSIRRIVIRYSANKYSYKKNNKIYVSAYPNIDFLFKSGKGSLYYAIDSQKFKKYRKKDLIKINQEKEYILHYYFIKNAKKTAIQKVNLIVDKTFPAYSILVNGTHKKSRNIKISKNREIRITAKDKGSGVKEILYAYKDDHVYYLYKGYIPLLNKKVFRIYFKLVDNVGNTSPVYYRNISLLK